MSKRATNQPRQPAHQEYDPYRSQMTPHEMQQFLATGNLPGDIRVALDTTPSFWQPPGAVPVTDFLLPQKAPSLTDAAGGRSAAGLKAAETRRANADAKMKQEFAIKAAFEESALWPRYGLSMAELPPHVQDECQRRLVPELSRRYAANDIEPPMASPNPVLHSCIRRTIALEPALLMAVEEQFKAGLDPRSSTENTLPNLMNAIQLLGWTGYLNAILTLMQDPAIRDDIAYTYARYDPYTAANFAAFYGTFTQQALAAIASLPQQPPKFPIVTFETLGLSPSSTSSILATLRSQHRQDQRQASRAHTLLPSHLRRMPP